MKRRLARELAVQCLYQMEMNDVTSADALDMLIEESKADNEANIDVTDEEALRGFVVNLVEGTRQAGPLIDEVMTRYLKGWKMDRLSRVDRQVLRLGMYEMLFRDDVPPKAAINEAIDLAKHFGFEESGKFVNGVLGQFIKELDEVKAQVRALKE